MNSNSNRAEIVQEWWKTLPFAYSSLRVSEGSRPEGFRFYKYIINIEANLNGRDLLVCGEANTRDLAMTKAIAELLERSALFAHQDKVAFVSSNGWAAHSTMEDAKSAAIMELVERDAILAQWYTRTPFLEIDFLNLPPAIQHWVDTELDKSEFPFIRVLLSTEGLGPSITCVFMNESGYGVASHATRPTIEESIESAIGEACRAAHLSLRKAFWQDSIKLKTGQAGQIEPGAHSVYYAYHEPFPKWMFGADIDCWTAMAKWREGLANVAALDFTFEAVLDNPVIVGFAASPLALNLTWGTTDKEQILKTTGGKRLADLNKEWNLKPHIIS
jgi:hypothetical protein